MSPVDHVSEVCNVKKAPLTVERCRVRESREEQSSSSRIAASGCDESCASGCDVCCSTTSSRGLGTVRKRVLKTYQEDKINHSRYSIAVESAEAEPEEAILSNSDAQEPQARDWRDR